MSKVISELLWFCITSPVIGSKFSRHFFNQPEVKTKPIVARACTFSRALCTLRVITSSFDWFTGLSPSLLECLNKHYLLEFKELICTLCLKSRVKGGFTYGATEIRKDCWGNPPFKAKLLYFN